MLNAKISSQYQSVGFLLKIGGITMARDRAVQVFLSLLGCTVLAIPCHAYLDPGTGSIILQSILAGIAVAMGVLRLYWYRLKAFFSGKSRTPDSKDAEDAEVRNES
jgi:hypothetical protein